MITPRRIMLAGAILALAFGVRQPLWAGPEEQFPPPSRLGCPGLEQTILEALAYLEDNQVRDRPGRGSCLRDSSDEGDGCRGRLSVNLPCHEDVGLPGCPVRNRSGEWASHIHLLPARLGVRGRSPVAAQDSNLFVTAAVAYGLFLYDDACLPGERRFVSLLLDQALADIAGLKRNEAYNFWPLQPGVESPLPRTGPLNVPVPRVRRLASFYVNNRLPLLFGLLTRGQQLPPREWLAACLDPHLNPWGADSLMNTPNDADDTALAVTVQTLYARRCPGRGAGPDLGALERVTHFRDLGRWREDGRDAWKGKDTGAFLTWLKVEDEPPFADPRTGVMPLAVNNVDAVVNANVALALALTGGKGLPGYADCLCLLARTARERLWPEAGLYYPLCVMFPYAASRAYRDGGACEGPMRPAMGALLGQLLDVQEEWGRRHPRHRGAFPGGADRSDHLATALGLSALLNLGRPLAWEMGQEERYDRAVHTAAAYLIRVRKSCRIVNASTRERLGAAVRHAAVWESGLFFSNGTDLAHWRSQAITAGAVLEALGKYAVAYDLDPDNLCPRRLALVAGTGSEGGLGLVVVTPEGRGRWRVDGGGMKPLHHPPTTHHSPFVAFLALHCRGAFWLAKGVCVKCNNETSPPPRAGRGEK
jgi:hypothetical protein